MAFFADDKNIHSGAIDSAAIANGGIESRIKETIASTKIWLQESPALDIFNKGITYFKNNRLDLSHPGTCDDVCAEVSKNLVLSNFAFSGLRAEVSKIFNKEPLFTTSQSFSIASQTLPPYQFQTMFGYDNLFMRGAVDNDGTVQGIAQVQWQPWSSTKIQTLLSQQSASMMHIEHDYQGRDHHWNVKALNPNIAEGITGIFVGNYLQSITKRLALGLELTWQKPPTSLGTEDVAINYVAKFNAGDYIAAAHLSLAEGKLTSTFWRRINQNIEAGVEIQLTSGTGRAAQQMMMMGQGGQKDGITALVAKYEFRQGTFRGQVDTQGKVGAYYEKRINGPFMITFSGDIDHLKNKANIGLGLSVELAGSEEIAAQQQQQMQMQM